MHDATALRIASLLQTQVASVLQMKTKKGGEGEIELSKYVSHEETERGLTGRNQGLSHSLANTIKCNQEPATRRQE